MGRRKFSQELHDRIASLAGTIPGRDIAAAVGIEYSQLKNISQAYGIPLHLGYVTLEDMPLIEGLRASGLSRKAIAEKFDTPYKYFCGRIEYLRRHYTRKNKAP